MVTECTRRRAVWIGLLAVLANSLRPPVLTAGNWFARETTTVQQLASQIDKLQEHIDRFGTIVAKDPDVWGQSRLMTHRAEFENEMKKELDDFQFRLNAAEFTRDAAFLSQALSLQASLDGQAQPANTVPPAVATATNQTVVIPNQANPNQATTANGNNAFVPRNEFSSGFSSTFRNEAAQLELGIEPTIELDQLKRYLDHLNEIRRLNEGDDTADSPGYALHLVRIPVSILPGKQTHKGYGAEITMTIQPQLSEELLPNAFRDFVINGVRDRITPQVLGLADRSDITLLRASAAADALHVSGEGVPAAVPTGMMRSFMALEISPDPVVDAEDGDQDPYIMNLQRVIDESHAVQEKLREIPGGSSSSNRQSKYLKAERLNSALTADEEQSGGPLVVGPLPRNGRLSVPFTHHTPLNGRTLRKMALDVFDFLAAPEQGLDSDERDNAKPGRRGLFFPDVAAFVRDESGGAYDFLSEPAAMFLWEAHCTQELARAVREVRHQEESKNDQEGFGPPSLERMREGYFTDLFKHFPGIRGTTTANLTWHIIVESALLNEELVEDMRRLAAEKNAWCLTTDWLPYYGPHPPIEARMAFNEYVKCRWPIHVFALDPVTQDQNVAAGFSLRREMQLLLAVAASRRLITLQSLTQFVRRLEYDLETIDLNRTAIGFTHGSDTFGWRFYPRVQVPEVQSNLSAAFHDLLIGGPNRDDRINDRRLEPGIRECTALVVMPSFVPNVILDTRSDWFKLADHHNRIPPRFLHRKGQLRDAVDLSADIVELRRLSHACAQDAHLYREGEVYRLQRAVHTMDRQLPLQTAFVEMPYENLLGGFDLFNSSVLGLKPTLRGWYGAPGIVVEGNVGTRSLAALLHSAQRELALAEAKLRAAVATNAPQEEQDRLKADRDAARTHHNTTLEEYRNSLRAFATTTLYLVGKNFSVLDTRVICGGVEIPEEHTKLISRDVIQITVPSSVSPVTENGRPFVDVHLATPYGPTPRLRIPVANDESASASAAATSAVQAKAHAEEAKKQAQAAQDAARHFAWHQDTMNVQVRYKSDTLLQFAEITRHGTNRAMLVGNSPTPFHPLDLEAGSEPVDLGFFLAAKFKGDTIPGDITNASQRKQPFITQSVRGVRDGSTGKVTYDLTEGLLIAMTDGLTKLGVAGEIEELVVDGYVRAYETGGAGQSHTDARPIVRLPALKLNVIQPSSAPNSETVGFSVQPPLTSDRVWAQSGPSSFDSQHSRSILVAPPAIR